MDIQRIAQMTYDHFNDRTFTEKDRSLFDPDVVVVDIPTGQELRGFDAYTQYSQGFITAMPDIRGTVLENQVSGNTVKSRIRGQGTFTGQLQTPQGMVPGTGNPVDIEYRPEMEFNEAGKIKRFAVNYDIQDFMRQLGIG
jgi:hypothetical protein